mgnify:CR=1 FL=1
MEFCESGLTTAQDFADLTESGISSSYFEKNKPFQQRYLPLH